MLPAGRQRALAPAVRSVGRSARPRALSSAAAVTCRPAVRVLQRPRRASFATVRPYASWGFGRRSCGPAAWHSSSPLHRPDCHWLHSNDDPRTTPRDKDCPACQTQQASRVELSRKELEWEREQQRASSLAAQDHREWHRQQYEVKRQAFEDMLNKDPYEALFGWSNRRLGGMSDSFPWSRSWGRPPFSLVSRWRKEARQILADHYKQGFGAESPEPVSHSATSAAKETSPAQQKPVINASVSWQTSTFKDGKHSSSSGELIYDPISGRMVPKGEAASSGIIQTTKLTPDSSKPAISIPVKTSTEPAYSHFTETLTASPRTEPRASSFQQTKKYLENSWAEETKRRADESGQPIESANRIQPALDRVARKGVHGARSAEGASASTANSELMKSTLLNLARMTPPDSIVQSSPRTSAHARLEDAKLQALREMSETEAWTFESLCSQGAERIGLLTKRVEVKALEILVKQDPVAFRELPKLAKDLSAHPKRELQHRQQEWEMRANAHDRVSKRSSWPTSKQDWMNFKNDTASNLIPSAKAAANTDSARTLQPVQYSSKEARHAYLSVFRKDKPLRHMSPREIGLHRGHLLKAWTSRLKDSYPRTASKADELLNEEIRKQRDAMAAFETKWAAGNPSQPSPIKTPASTSSNLSALAGEGDIDSKVVDFCQEAKWYKRKAPHAMLEEELKEGDKWLVQEIKAAYESTYGTIDENHKQASVLENSLDEYERRIGDDAYSFKSEALRPAATKDTPQEDQTHSQVTQGLKVPDMSDEQHAKNVDRLLDMYRKQSDTYVETIGRLQRKNESLQQQIKRTSNSKPQVPLMDDKQHAKNVNSLLDMYRKQSDGYVEMIGRLQRKTQGLQQQVERLQAQQTPSNRPAISAPEVQPALPKPAQKFTNPVDGTTGRQINDLVPQTGNFASPTGYVGEAPPSEEVAQHRSAEPATGSRVVRREEPVFSGQQPLQKVSVQEIIDLLHHRLGTVPNPSPATPSASSSGSSTGQNATDSTARVAESRQTFGERVLALFVSMIFAGTFFAVTAYAIGVVVEYFRSGPSGPSSPGSGGSTSKHRQARQDERGWSISGRHTRRGQSEPTSSTTGRGNELRKDETAKMADELPRHVATVLFLPFVGLTAAYACIALLRNL